MEQSMDQIAAKCAKQLDTFQRCILANRAEPSQCDPYKVELSRCAADAVPLLNEVKQRCSPQVLAYDRCLAQFQSQGDEALEKNCTPRLRDLWHCTEKVKQEAQARDDAGVKASI